VPLPKACITISTLLALRGIKKSDKLSIPFATLTPMRVIPAKYKTSTTISAGCNPNIIFIPQELTTEAKHKMLEIINRK
jgi:hypothetical protein